MCPASTILDIKSVHSGIHTTSKTGRSFYIYIIHKPIEVSIDFSYRLKPYDHWVETSKSVNWKIVPCPNTKNHLLSLSELADRK